MAVGNSGGSRADGDSWDIASSVGATAAGVAAARAAETAREDRLICDQFAAVLIDGPELKEMLAKSSELAATVPGYGVVQRQMVDYHAARTHYFDAFFTSAAAAGLRQAVILASGLDSRAFRLPWPERTTVFEIDQPEVLKYKSSRLTAVGAATTATTWRRVPVDLRDDWPTALCNNGFDPVLPTAWSTEGLLPFLTGQSQDALLRQVERLSAPGSRIAVECYRADGSLVAWIERMDQRLRAEAGDEAAEAFSAGDIWYDDRDRAEPVDWLSSRGWRTRSVAAADYLAQLGRPLPPDEDPFAALANFVVAERGESSG